MAASLTAWLAAEPGLSGVELFRRAREMGYRGGKTALYDFVRRLRARDAATRQGPDAGPGVYAMLEFIAVDVRFAGDAPKRALMLVAELTWSGFVHASVGFQFDASTAMRCLREAFVAFGGVPLALRWTSPRLVVRHEPTAASAARTRPAVVWAPAVADLALQTGCAVQLYDADDRRRRTTRALRAWILTAGTFQDRADFETRLQAWLADVNTATEPRRGTSAAERLRDEQPRLLGADLLRELTADSGNAAP